MLANAPAIGVVGFGKMGLLHASLLSAAGARIAAVCERQPLLRRFGRRMLPGTAFVRDVADMSRFGLDGVYVTTPPGSHYAVVSEVLTRGIARHIFVEKPLAVSAGQAARLVALAKDIPGAHMVGYQKRFAVTFRKAKDVLSEGVLGDLQSFEAHAYSSDFSGVDAAGVRARARGGVLRDLGCHAVDALLWFFGSISVASAEYFKAEPRDPIESLSVRLRTPEGATGTLRVSACMSRYRLPEIGIGIAGARGNLSVNDDRVEVRLGSAAPAAWYRQALHDEVPFLLAEPEYMREDRRFLQAITENVPEIPGFGDGLQVETAMDDMQSAAGSV